MALTRSFEAACWFRSGKDTAQSLGETCHRALWIIGWHVFFLGVLVGGFFQHVCGNSEPVSAV